MLYSRKRLLSLWIGSVIALCADSDLNQKLLMMDLESLSQIKVSDDSSTLIGVEKRYIPAMVTTITQQDIVDSGARSLDELLEIYVPDLAYMFKVDGNQLGIGGIISDRNNKILLTLNGKVLNIRGKDGGAVTERWYSMLGDIEAIEVISGPGSVIYGPGAIAGVINIKTYSADTFKGLEATERVGGYGEEFASTEIKYGTVFENGLGLFLYAGIDDYRGIDKDDLINKFAFDRPERDIHAYQNFDHPMVNLNGSFVGQKRKKFYIELTGDNFSLWSRFAKGSLAMPTYQHFYMFAKPETMIRTGSENDQWSSNFSYKHRTDILKTVYSVGFVRSELEKRNLYYFYNDRNIIQKPKKQNEDIATFKVVSTYELDDNCSYAFGAAYDYNHFLKYYNSYVPLFSKPRSWHTGLSSLFAETQQRYGRFETIADLRIDKHTYTGILPSCRIATAYKIDKQKTLKANYSHAVRHMDEIDIYKQVKETGKNPDIEYIDRVEAIYDYKAEGWSNYLRYVFGMHHIIAFNEAIKQTGAIGTVKFYSIEGKIGYHTQKSYVSLSHTFTSLVSFDDKESVPQTQNVSAAAYGYGKDFANWHNHITKLRFVYHFSEALKMMGSLRVFWGMPGAVDMADYNKDHFESIRPENHRISIPYYKLPDYTGSKKAFGPNAYLNLSLSYRINERSRLLLHGYNLLGLFDKDINKRNYFQTTSNYFDEAPAVSISLHYRF